MGSCFNILNQAIQYERYFRKLETALKEAVIIFVLDNVFLACQYSTSHN